MRPQQPAAEGNWSESQTEHMWSQVDVHQSFRSIQRYVDHAFTSRIEQAIEHLGNEMAVMKQIVGTICDEMVMKIIVGLRDELRQLTCPCSNNCHADQHTRQETVPLFPNRDRVSEMRNVASSNVPGDYAADRPNTTNIGLRFLNVSRRRVYTDTKITSEDGQDIKVAMCEGDSRTIITSGPLSSVKVEILVLRGEFSRNEYIQGGSEEDFERHIVQGRDGQGLVLGTVRLVNGWAELSQIRFKEGSCRKEVILAARVCRGETNLQVQEAVMKPVVVLDRRNESNEKSSSPKLDDKVYRLEDIARGGVYHRRLQQAEIHTVQDFLKALNKDPDKLCNILKTKSNSKSWSKMTGHARKRTLEGNRELKAYETEDGNAVLFFNSVHDLVGARFGVGGNFIACEQFNEHQTWSVDRLKVHAYDSLERIPYDHVMTDDAPEPISSSTSAAAGPGPSVVLSVNAGQPNYIAEHRPESYYHGCQGTGAASHDDINLGNQPIPNTHDCQGIPPPGQPQITLPSVWPNRRQHGIFPPDDRLGHFYQAATPDPEVQYSSVPMDVEWQWEGELDLNQTGHEHLSWASTSTLPNFEVEAHLPRPHQTFPAASTAEMTMATAQSLFAEDERYMAVLRFQDHATTETADDYRSLGKYLLDMNISSS